VPTQAEIPDETPKEGSAPALQLSFRMGKMTRTSDPAATTINEPRRADGGSREAFHTGRQPPLVSIIVVAFRDRDEVAALIENIRPFRGADVELVIIDGGSDDGTPELLQARNDEVDYWVSEPDSGIYEAMNKGIAAARAEYILHLNAGDRLISIPVEALHRGLEDNIDVAGFRVLMDGKDLYVPRTGFPMRIDNWWHHQGTFYRRQKHLGYDLRYQVFGDFEHNQRLLKSGCSVRLHPEIVAAHNNNGISMGQSARFELYRSIRIHFGPVYLPIAFARFELNKLRAAIKRLSQKLFH
jgi:glycosyltransferase involved in cell wall biosynthesis